LIVELVVKAEWLRWSSKWGEMVFELVAEMVAMK